MAENRKPTTFDTSCKDIRRISRGFAIIAWLMALAWNASAQSAPGNAISTPPGTDVSTTQLAVPGGAGATATNSGNASAGAILGFQIWQQDKFFLASFFTFSTPQTFTGQPPASGQTTSAQQSTFGALLLNPPNQGTSYAFTGNYMWGVYPKADRPCTTAKAALDSTGRLVVDNKGKVVTNPNTANSCTVDNAILFYGGELRGGITNTTWTESTATPTSLNATIGYLAPEVLVTSKTYKFNTDGNTENQYQFGVALGPSFRFIGGDIAQNPNTAFRTALLGTTKSYLAGFETTFFVRLNQFKPYVRFTHFGASTGANIASFSGNQFVFGVDVLSPLIQTTLPK